MFTSFEIFLFIIVVSLGTMLTRFLPFLIFNEKKPIPKYVLYLGRVLPYSITGFLIVYCLKDVNWTGGNHGLPEIIAIISIILIHIYKRNTLLSILIGTTVYMLLLHLL